MFPFDQSTCFRSMSERRRAPLAAVWRKDCRHATVQAIRRRRQRESAGFDLPTTPEAALNQLLQPEHRQEHHFMRLLARRHPQIADSCGARANRCGKSGRSRQKRCCQRNQLGHCPFDSISTFALTGSVFGQRQHPPRRVVRMGQATQHPAHCNRGRHR